MNTETKKSKKLWHKNNLSDAAAELNSFVFWMSRQAYWSETAISENGKHVTVSGSDQYGGGVPNYFTPLVDSRKLGVTVHGILVE